MLSLMLNAFHAKSREYYRFIYIYIYTLYGCAFTAKQARIKKHQLSDKQPQAVCQRIITNTLRSLSCHYGHYHTSRLLSVTQLVMQQTNLGLG